MKIKNFKFQKTTIYIPILVIMFFGIVSCENEPINSDVNPGLLITKNSELYNLFTRITTNVDDPLTDIVCVEFSYPFISLVYDENLEIIGEVVLYNNDEFYILLDNLDENHSLSISYPIEATLSDGTNLNITNNEELKIAINNCAQEDIIGYCGSVFEEQGCAWKVPFIEGAENEYAGGVFTVNTNSTLNFNFQNTDYTGVWTFFFIEDVLNFNINISGNSQVAQDWNINFDVQFDDGKIILSSPTNNYTLKKVCELAQEFNIGDTGPAGGIVAYDKGIFSNGWRYIETDAVDLVSEEWGCISGDVTVSGTDEIGFGLMSSAAIANFHLNLQNYSENPAICDAANDGTVTAITALHSQQNQERDWFLPSHSELLLLYDNLHTEGIGGFSNAIYWSASQSGISEAKAIDFSTGESVEIMKNTSGINTRAIRYF